MLWSVFWGVLRLLFACIQYINTCKLPFSLSGFSLKSTTHRAIVSGLCSSYINALKHRWYSTSVLYHLWLKFASEQHKCKAKKQADLKSTIQWNKPFREAGLGCAYERVRHCLEAHTLGGRGNLPPTPHRQHWLLVLQARPNQPQYGSLSVSWDTKSDLHWVWLARQSLCLIIQHTNVEWYTAVTPTAGQSYALMCCSQQNYSSEYLICWIPEPSTCVHTLHSTPRLYLPRGYTTVTREADAANDVHCKCGS